MTENNNKQLIKDAMVLTIITLIAGLALGFVSMITEKPIAEAKAAALKKAYSAVFEEADEFESLKDFDSKEATKIAKDAGNEGDNEITDCLIAKDKDKNALGYIISVTTHDGYGGDIVFSVGITNEGNMNGYSITSIDETPGLGMKATENAFMKQFKNIPVGNYSVTKTSPANEGEILAISGATITSRSVTNGVDAAMAYFNSLTGSSEEGGEAGE